MKTNRNNLSTLRFVPKESTGKKPKNNNHQPKDFLNNMLYHPNEETAVQLVGEQAGLTFDHKSKGEIEQIKLDQVEINNKFKESNATGDKLANKKNNTDPEIKSTNDEKDIPFKDWKTKDKVTTIFIFPMIIIGMIMGSSNVYGNLIASGNSVLLNSPWIAIFLSALMPIASLSIKFVSNFIELDRIRKRYSFSIYSFTFIMLIFWSVLFALNFNGISGGLDYESLGESNYSSSLLVWSQLLLEILMTAGLALALEDISSKYSHDKWITNVKFTSIKKSIDAHEKKHEKLRLKRNQMHARLIELESLRKTTINKKIAEYISLRARFTQANTTNFNF